MIDFNNNCNFTNNNYIKVIKNNYHYDCVGVRMNNYSDNNRINNMIRNKQKNI